MNEVGDLFEKGLTFDSFKSSVTKTTEKLHEKIKEELKEEAGGTTIVGLFVMQKTYIAFNVGDSRAYMLEQGSDQG